LLERGHVESVSIRTLRRVLGALDARAIVELHWRAGDLDRLVDESHAHLAAQVVSSLRRHGWLAETEVTYARYGERGSYDVIAFHAAAGVVLVVEVKTDLPSAEATLRKLDEKVRLAPTVAHERFGWRAKAVGRLLVMPEDRTLRRRVDRHSALLVGTFPDRSLDVRKWLAQPSGRLAGLWFLTVTNAGSGSRTPGGRVRVRAARSPSVSNEPAA
jgi:hypothetical protein